MPTTPAKGLLIVTQAVDLSDPVLGFFHRWIEEFSKYYARVTVLCLREGEHHLPGNVTVVSLGKEQGRASPFTYIWRFLRHVIRLRKTYDVVFVHMNPEYLVVGGPLWKCMNKKTALWYAHKSVTPALRAGLLFTDNVFSVTESSFGIMTPKLLPTGHGVDTGMFKQQKRSPAGNLRLITVGRIADSKHLKEMLPLVEELERMGTSPVLTIVGDAGTAAERRYKAELVAEIERRGLGKRVIMYGPAPHAALPGLFEHQDIFLNFGSTGNMDKAGFEPLSAGLPMVTTNEAFKEVLAPYGMYVGRGDTAAIADVVLRAQKADMESLAAYVRANHSLVNLIPKIVSALA